MDFQTRLRAFLGQHQSIGWLLVLMLAGLLVQLLIFMLSSAVGSPEAYDQIVSFLVLPPHIKGLFPAIWSLITYPFFDLDIGLRIFHVLITGLILWSFGRIHQQLLGEQRTKRLIILGVPVIGLLTVLLSTVLFTQSPKATNTQKSYEESTSIEQVDSEEAPAEIAKSPTDEDSESAQTETLSQSQQAAGAVSSRSLYTGGLMAIVIMLVISCITLVPDYPIQLFLFGQVKIVWVGLGLLFLELYFAMFFTPQAIAIMLGAGLGFLHVYLLKNGTDLTEKVWAFYQSDDREPRMTVKYGGNQRKSESAAASQSGRGAGKGKIPQDIIDGILDKISDQGYDSLSREEKELLFKASIQKEDENTD